MMPRLPNPLRKLRSRSGRWSRRLGPRRIGGFLAGRRPSRKQLGLAALVVVVLLVGLRSARGSELVEIEPPVVAISETLTLTVPERIEAGDGFVIGVEGTEPGVVVRATLDAGYGLRQLAVTPSDTSTELEVRAFDGPASGQVLLSVIQGDLTATATIEVEPGPPVDPIDVYLGPRTVIADTEHFVMLVAVPEDRWGNPVAEGTFVDFQTTRADLGVETQRYPTEDLVAWYEVFSGTVAGRSRIAASSGSAGAPERTFLEVADIPSTYSLELVETILPADGSALLTIRTDVLADRFDNVLPDGTVVALDAEGVTGIRRIHSQTIDGRGEFTLEVPDQPGTVTLVATASGVQSEPLELDFASAVLSLSAEVEVAPEVAIVEIGPVRSVRDSYVPEGTVATVTAADGRTATADLSLGVGTAYLPAGTDVSRVTVEVLGTKIVVRSDP